MHNSSISGLEFEKNTITFEVTQMPCLGIFGLEF